MPVSAIGTVLNVNDSPGSLYLASHSLRRAGYQVLEAVTCAEALKLAEEIHIDVCVLDVKLPDGSGYDVCRAMRSNAATSHIAIINTSATFITADKKVAGLRAGADCYLTQPFDPEELIATVASVLRLRRAEQAARATSERLSEADRKKNEFLAMLGHELRNPLAAISSAAALLGPKAERDPDVARLQGIIERQAKQLGRLVEDLLDVGRISQGKYELRLSRLDLRSVLTHVHAAAQLVACERGLRLAPLLLGDSPLWVHGDRSRLEQVFANLLDNASKYTDAGGALRLDVEEDGADVCVSITDTGIGMPPEALSRIFELFTQLDSSLDRARGGLGIGLTLVERMVKQHGGRVHAASEGPGKGSRFTVRLPKLSDDGKSEGATVLPFVRREDRPCHILLVEDNDDIRFGMREMLEMWGHSVTEAGDGASALAAVARAEVPLDVAILDIGLPVMDGYQLAGALRRVVGNGPRLVALTGYGTAEDRDRAIAAGFNQHLVKPVDLVELGRTLAQLGGAVRGQSADSSQEHSGG